MGGVADVAVNVAAGLLVFFMGVAARFVYSILRNWHGRRFWGPGIRRGRTLLFLGWFTRFNDLEPTGFVGLGDARAVHELTEGLGAIGVSFEMAYASRLKDSDFQENLILFGWEEVNSLTTAVMANIDPTFQVDADAMRITDTLMGKRYDPRWEEGSFDLTREHAVDGDWVFSADGKSARRLQADYGVVVRARNPFNPSRTVMLICGVYGHATLAGARLLLDADFQRRCAQVEDFDVECLFEVQVVRGQLLPARIIAFRDLSRGGPPAVDLRRRPVSGSETGEVSDERA